MAVVTVPVQVARPGPGPELQPYGLFSVATGPLDLPVHAIEGGLQFQTPFCGLPQGYAVACAPGSKAASLVGGYTTVTGNPFVVLAGSECGAITGGLGGQSPDEFTRDLVINKLRAGEQRLVENIFSTGASGQAPALTSGSALAASLTIPDAFGLLESEFAKVYGLLGVIHVPLVAMGQVMNAHQVRLDGNVWRTASGNAVNFGNYTGNAPGGAAPAADHTNIYITGPVTVWRTPDSNIFVSPWAESIDKTTNQIHRFAEREYVVTWECTALATDVTYKTCC